MSSSRLPGLPRKLGAGLAVVAVAGLLAGCEKPASNVVKSQPYQLEEIEGTDIKRVKLSDETAANIDLQTSTVRASGKQLIVPHAALIYNPEGKVFVYTRPGPETYVRAPVTVDRVVGDEAFLSKAPPAATAVVTVGAAELLATEYEILNQHP